MIPIIDEGTENIFPHHSLSDLCLGNIDPHFFVNYDLPEVRLLLIKFHGCQCIVVNRIDSDLV